MSTWTVFLAPCAIAAILATTALGCGDGGDGEGGAPATGTTTSAPAENLEASAIIAAKSGSTMKGIALFTVDGDDATVKISVTDVAPGEHAVHIHEMPDCSAEDAMSAGEHWNPTMSDHGKWGDASFHLGDIGNMTVGDDGIGSLTFRTDLWTVGTGETNDIVNHAIVVHADPDDFVSQPSGNAGTRIGCGVIEKK